MHVSHRDVGAGETVAAAPGRTGHVPAGNADPAGDDDGGIQVRYWAGARAAAGVDTERVPTPATVADLLVTLAAARPALAAALPVCSILVDGRATRSDHAVPAGCTVEVLPPFAGG
ncbi:MAG: MoaD/ThiS family protein [Dermatophilaceae bacterium]